MARKTKKSAANYDPAHLPDRIRELRLTRRVSQQALCRLSAVPQATIASIEKGGMPRWDVVLRLASALGVTLDELAAPPSGEELAPIGNAELRGKLPPEARPRPEKPRPRPRKPRAPPRRTGALRGSQSSSPGSPTGVPRSGQWVRTISSALAW
jgi:transcriptional regulator with XRE-family HTH domain